MALLLYTGSADDNVVALSNFYDMAWGKIQGHGESGPADVQKNGARYRHVKSQNIGDDPLHAKDMRITSGKFQKIFFR